MKTVCEQNMCTGCMACVDICPKGAVEIVDDLLSYNAVIREDVCIACNACHRVCQNNRAVAALPPILWQQGWVENDIARQESSSGGAATRLMTVFSESGGSVYSCTFRNGCFGFERAENAQDVKKFIGSKYVKSNPQGTYVAIKKELAQGARVLFLGLPCQVAALKCYVGDTLAEQLYTVDLICHGTPSPRVLEAFLKQYKLSLDTAENIGFRAKAKFEMRYNGHGVIREGVTDKYSLAFLKGLIYTENCYSCPYAKGERVSDITLGDSWGSELPEAQQKKGISLILCQTGKGRALLDAAELHTEPVVPDKAIAHNHQLKHPSPCPKGRAALMNGLLKGEKFNRLVTRCLPRNCAKQNLKSLLLKLKILKQTK